MKRIKTILLNSLWFYFVVDIINGIQISHENLSVTILIALLAGAVMWSVRPVLVFFKISTNDWSMFFLGLTFSFILFFSMYLGVLNIGSIGPSIIDLGIVEDSIVTFDQTGTLLVATLAMGLGSTGLRILTKD